MWSSSTVGEGGEYSGKTAGGGPSVKVKPWFEIARPQLHGHDMTCIAVPSSDTVSAAPQTAGGDTAADAVVVKSHWLVSGGNAAACRVPSHIYIRVTTLQPLDLIHTPPSLTTPLSLTTPPSLTTTTTAVDDHLSQHYQLRRRCW